MAMCHARGIALHLFRWIRMWCIVKTPDDEILDDLPSKHMVEILDALLSYKSKADLWKLKGAPHCGLWMLKAQILNVVKCDSSVEKLWTQRKGKPSDSLRMTLEEGTTVHWKDDAPRVTIHQSKLSFYLDLCKTQYPQQISTSKLASPNSIASFSMENSTDHNWRSRLFRRNHV